MTNAARRLAGYRRKAGTALSKDWRAHRYPTPKSSGCWQRPEDMKRHASPSDRAYYVDSFEELGWRTLGTAYDVSRRADSRAVEEIGWYCDAYQNETVSGYVLQLPARNGVPQYVPALGWSDRDGVTLYPLDRYDEPLDAARAANGYAERTAETEREYNEAWQAGSQWSDLSNTIAVTRSRALALLREMRPDRKQGTGRPAICAALRERLASMLDDIREAREKRAELADTHRWQADAFNDGACETVIT